MPFKFLFLRQQNAGHSCPYQLWLCSCPLRNILKPDNSSPERTNLPLLLRPELLKSQCTHTYLGTPFEHADSGLVGLWHFSEAPGIIDVASLWTTLGVARSWLRSVVLKLWQGSEWCGGLMLKYGTLISNPRNSDSVWQGCICTLTSFQVRLIADPGATFAEWLGQASAFLSQQETASLILKYVSL